MTESSYGGEGGREATKAPETAEAARAAEAVARLWERVVTMHARLEGRLDHTLTRRHGVGTVTLMTLGVLVGEHPGSVMVADVARRMSVSPSAASRMLARLERAGWVTRVAWPCDRRISRMAATEAGRRVWSQASRTLDRELDVSFGALKFDERYAHVVARLCRGEDDRPGPDRPGPDRGDPAAHGRP
ncbi:MarR family winged helix-turn-helix transcriptional regulator [Streptomyces sp. NPDC058417]|uniref:MarR family winged helix-turn-helix transcriptional regulator n=1 Tax=unclassified Streptomyces TaxID=2593676 RepID=UPI00365D261F